MATEAITSIHCPGCQTTYDASMVDVAEIAFCPQCRFPLTLLAGKYRLERLLNQGGFGMLYLARHVGLDLFNERVIKVLKPELFAHGDVLKRFRREVQLTANLSEQNNHIVRIYDDFGEAPGLGQYYVMEYLRGLTLDAIQEAPRPLAFGLAIHIFYQLCKAMGASHRTGVIHRDLKPDNLFLIQRDADPHFVKVIDFGLARPGDSNTQIGSFATQQQVMGTPAYMSPEQCQGEDIDTRSDIYAMGIILYQMLCGHHPYPIDPSDTMALFFAHISGPSTPLETYGSSFPAGLDAVVRKALAKEPDQRYATAEAFWDALAPFAPAGTNYLPLSAPSPLYQVSSDGPGTSDASLDPLAFQATIAGVSAISESDVAALAVQPTAKGTAWETPSSGPSTAEIRDASLRAAQASPYEQSTMPNSGAHSPASHGDSDLAVHLLDEEELGTAETMLADVPDPEEVAAEEDTDDAAPTEIQQSSLPGDTDDLDDDNHLSNDDLDGATSISTFTPPTISPAEVSLQRQALDGQSIDDLDDDSEPDSGDTSISVAPPFPETMSEEEASTLGQEILAVPASELQVLLSLGQSQQQPATKAPVPGQLPPAANALTSPAELPVAAPRRGRVQVARTIHEGTSPATWKGAPPTEDMSQAAANAIAENLARKQRLASGERQTTAAASDDLADARPRPINNAKKTLAPARPPTSERYVTPAPTSGLGWGWLWVAFGVLAIVGLGVWLLLQFG